MEDLNILDTSTWPARPMIRYGEAEILRLAKQFQINERQALNEMRCLIDNESKPADIQGLVTCIKTIPCSSAEFERDFSVMNVIVSDLRSSLTVENTASLMFVNINGPPLACWQPEKYVKSWLICHRLSTDTRSRVEKKNSCADDCQVM